MPEVLRWWSVPVAAFLLMLPALINGFPLIFPDTATYIYQGIYFQGDSPWAMGYALFLRPFAQMGTLWPAIALQALVTIWAIQRLWISFGVGAPEQIVFLIALLTTTSALPWTISFVLPDIFVGLLILSIAAVASSHLTEKNDRDWLLIGLVTICSVMHASSILLVMLLSILVLLFAVVGLIWMASWRRNLRQLTVSIGILLVLSITTNLVINGVVHRRISVLAPYGGFGVALATLNQSGLVTPYLEANCDRYRYRLCEFKDSLPNVAGVFIFSPNSPFNVLGGFTGMEDEARHIVLDIVVQQPTQIIGHMWRTFKSQLVLLDVQEMMDGAMANPGVLPLLEKDGITGLEQYRNALQHSGHFPSPLIVSIQKYVVFASVILLLGLMSFGARLLKLNQVGGIGIIVAGILLNDLLSAAIAYPQDRFQTRVIWLLPTVVCLLLLSVQRSSSRTMRLDPIE